MSLTIKGSWLRRGRVAKHLASLLTPVPVRYLIEGRKYRGVCYTVTCMHTKWQIQRASVSSLSAEMLTRTGLTRTRTMTSLTVTYCKMQLNLQSLSSNNN